jgi:hypothetical protein
MTWLDRRRGLPGRCINCLAKVVWNHNAWRRPGAGGHVHTCSEDRPVCGVWMRNAQTTCARLPGHGTEHRTAYSMSNARDARTPAA